MTSARSAVFAAFALNGVIFATLFSRMPLVRSELGLSNAELGLLLLAGSGASVLALPMSGPLIERFTAGAVVRAGALLSGASILVVTVGASVLHSVPVVAVGLVGYGVGQSVWDVAMNVEGAAVERHVGRSTMPQLHAGWSVGSLVGAGVGVGMAAGEVPLPVHAALIVVLAVPAALFSVRYYLPATGERPHGPRPRSAWTEPRTLAIGLMVLAFALVEGVAYDWLALAVVDGYDAPDWVGTSAFSLFLVLMLAGRLCSPWLLGRAGRTAVLWACCAAAAGGVVLTVYGAHPALVGLGIAIWGLGASLGFPVGISAAADEPRRAPARVSVVSTIGYAAFLAGPPLLGSIGDAVGTLHSLLVVAVVMVPAALTVLAARPPAPRTGLPTGP